MSKKHRLLLDKAVGSVSPGLKGALFSVLVRGRFPSILNRNLVFSLEKKKLFNL